MSIKPFVNINRLPNITLSIKFIGYLVYSANLFFCHSKSISYVYATVVMTSPVYVNVLVKSIPAGVSPLSTILVSLSPV